MFKFVIGGSVVSLNLEHSFQMDFYRFSISWPRILPDGDSFNVNENGIEYYNKLIDKLLELNIQPMVTMFHYDLPQKLQLLGGFANPIIVDHFKAYAKLLFERFGDRVKNWITFNQPRLFCGDGYGSSTDAPGINLHGIGEYLCGHNVLKAHAVAYHLYKDEFCKKFNGQVGISIFSFFYYSHTNDTNVLDHAMQFSVCTLHKLQPKQIVTDCFISSFFRSVGLHTRFSAQMEIIRR